MIKFDKPVNLNGAELLEELALVGVLLQNKTQAPFVDNNGDLWLDIDPANQVKAKTIIATHNGTIVASDNTAAKAAAQAKLAALGLTTDDLKALGLGGNE